MYRVMTPADCDILIQQPDSRYFSGIRNRLIILLMIDLGVRISEVVGHEKRRMENGSVAGGLRIKDIDKLSGKIILYDTKDTRAISKKRKTIKAGRILYASGRLLESLIEWYLIREKINPCYPDSLLICTRSGDKVDNRYCRRMIKKYAKRAGINIDVSPHKARHAFASQFYIETKDIKLLQDILGHSSIKVTEGYVHLPEESIKNILIGRQLNEIKKTRPPKRVNNDE
jgi:site-specific recombinase XerD